MVFGWLKSWIARGKPPPWSVSIGSGVIVISDGLGTERAVQVEDLQRVAVATNDSGPWGEDVVFLLYSDALDPIGIFPLEADGVHDFLNWLMTMPGYRDRELAKAMSSTRVANFIIFETQA